MAHPQAAARFRRSISTLQWIARTPPARRKETAPPELRINRTSRVVSGETPAIAITGTVRDASGIASLRVYVNGHRVAAEGSDAWTATLALSRLNQWRDSQADRFVVLVLAKDKLGNAAAMLEEMTAP